MEDVMDCVSTLRRGGTRNSPRVSVLADWQRARGVQSFSVGSSCDYARSLSSGCTGWAAAADDL